MYVIRKFNLIGGKIDFQYVSSAGVNSANGKFLIGYDSKKEYALKLSPYLLRRVESELKKAKASYTLQDGI